MEKKYQLFISTLKTVPNKNTVDFLGLNLYDGDNEDIFKIYYANKFSYCEEHQILDFLQEKKMIQCIEMIKDTIHPECSRVDITLKNRSNSNMEALFEQLKEKTSLYIDSEEEMLNLACMNITDMPNNNFASLCHLGLIQNKEEIETLKYYFLTRWCENPDIPYINNRYQDEYYLKFLHDIKMKEYQKLAVLAKEILNLCGGHLWMVGMDVVKNSYRKYKVYIKEPNYIYENLSRILEGNLKQKIQDAARWNELHPELICEGMAFCLDTNNVFSINLYYGFI